nr:hypothetical protein [Halocalculus aciditolerans]
MIDHGDEPVYDDEDERTDAPLTASRHDRGSRRQSDRRKGERTLDVEASAARSASA